MYCNKITQRSRWDRYGLESLSPSNETPTPGAKWLPSASPQTKLPACYCRWFLLHSLETDIVLWRV